MAHLRGPSPRVRGRVIHARPRDGAGRVHPHTCGGEDRKVEMNTTPKGPSPARAGESLLDAEGTPMEGSIPARGESRLALWSRHPQGPSPRAGERVPTIRLLRRPKVHPPLRESEWRGLAPGAMGSIPARAGERFVARVLTTRTSGSIPPRAGERPYGGKYGGVWRRSRACGGEHHRVNAYWPAAGPSPRVRGRASRARPTSAPV